MENTTASSTTTMPFDTAFATVSTLAADFRAHQSRYLAPDYNEDEARKDFVDKFWIALGWDVNHDRQKNPYEQEVKVERGVVMHEGKKRADYAFYLAPDYRNVRFFVEAKKPSVELRNKDSYFQAVRYGWNASTPLVVLTDFEQFHILDCRAKPDPESVLDRAVATYRFSDYENAEAFARIYYLFSREAVAEGSIEKFVDREMLSADAAGRRAGRAMQRGLFAVGHQSIDEAFLSELDGYRAELARAVKEANPVLDAEALTEATQRILDRLVFLRFLEDKDIEPEPLIRNFLLTPSAWQAFQKERRRLDTLYNGVLFKEHLIDRREFIGPETTFSNICHHLASDTSPYLFSVVPIHILGSIYERFLGKVIVTDAGRAVVEEKPEVRKAGGVYYTPDYIVRYIVENTVGKLLEGKTPPEIAGLRFADIACGSGSFLLGVYDELLRWHTAYYNANPREAKRAGCEATDEGTWRLSLWQKRQILLNNIHGVDIDPQAVEVAQLSLYLKLLEAETLATAKEQHTLHGAILPSLSENIVCGNALIGYDAFLDGEEDRKVNAMEFAEASPTFRRIMRGGGFDAIVGNPPYIRIQTLQETMPLAVRYCKEKYESAKKGNYDLYVVFVERALHLLKPGGVLGYILPNKFFKTDYGEGLRRLLYVKQAITRIIDFGHSQVFDATTYTCLLFLSKSQQAHFQYAVAEASPDSLLKMQLVNWDLEELGKPLWLFSQDSTATLMAKIKELGKPLIDLPVSISRGSSSGDDKTLMLNASDAEIEPNSTRVPIFATDFNRYYFSPRSGKLIVFPYKTEDNGRLISEEELSSCYPKAYHYLLSNKDKLKLRKGCKTWYAFAAPRNLVLHENAHIVVPLLANHGQFAPLPESKQGKYCLMASGGFSITLSPTCQYHPHYVLGLINSRLLFWFLRQISNIFRGGWITCTKQYIGALPVRNLNLAVKTDKDSHDLIVRLVEQRITAAKARAEAITDRDIQYHDRRCRTLDAQIDDLVYRLYNLTDAEIALIEEGDTPSTDSIPASAEQE